MQNSLWKNHVFKESAILREKNYKCLNSKLKSLATSPPKQESKCMGTFNKPCNSIAYKKDDFPNKNFFILIFFYTYIFLYLFCR